MTPIELSRIMQAIHDLVVACEAVGVRPPTSIAFKSQREANLIGDAAISARASGDPWAAKHVLVASSGKVTIEGASIGVKW